MGASSCCSASPHGDPGADDEGEADGKVVVVVVVGPVAQVGVARALNGAIRRRRTVAVLVLARVGTHVVGHQGAV